MKPLFFVVIIATVGGAFWWESATVGKLRTQNEQLRASKEEADRLRLENRELQNEEFAPASRMSSEERLELLRLRNEVRQLRAESPQLEKLGEENQRLADELTSGKITPRRLVNLEGTVAREDWRHAGFATPEAAIQTFFWAMASRNIEAVFQSVGPDTSAGFRSAMLEDPDEFRESFLKDNPFARASGFRIVTRTNVNDDKLRLEVQLAADGMTVLFPLRRVGNEWRVEVH